MGSAMRLPRDMASGGMSHFGTRKYVFLTLAILNTGTHTQKFEDVVVK